MNTTNSKIIVLYNKKRMSLSRFAQIIGIPYRNLRQKWVRRGRPMVVNRSMFDNQPGGKIHRVKVGDHCRTFRELSVDWNVLAVTIVARWDTLGRPIIPSANDIEYLRYGKDARIVADPMSSPTNEAQEDRSPGWAERKYFPDAGQHGYHQVEKVWA